MEERLVESRFTLPGPMCIVNGTVETSSSPEWRAVRRGKGSVSHVVTPCDYRLVIFVVLFLIEVIGILSMCTVY